jgi:HSP20 family protein
VAKLAVPGLKPDDFEITMQDSVLRVHGETRVEEQTGQEEQARYHVREQRFGTFDRVVRFPSAVDNEQVSASLSEGILTVRVPKSEAAKPKRITVTPS